MITQFCILNTECIFVGDYNMHFENTTNTFTKKVTKLLGEHDLKQYVYGPTQTFGHTIDCIIVPECDSFLQSVDTFDKQVSDHHCILCTKKP